MASCCRGVGQRGGTRSWDDLSAPLASLWGVAAARPYHAHHSHSGSHGQHRAPPPPPPVEVRVVGLFLDGWGLRGGLPSSLGRLGCLAVLELPHNGLQGEVPAALALLTRLRRVNLASNRLGGLALRPPAPPPAAAASPARLLLAAPRPDVGPGVYGAGPGAPLPSSAMSSLAGSLGAGSAGAAAAATSGAPPPPPPPPPPSLASGHLVEELYLDQNPGLLFPRGAACFGRRACRALGALLKVARARETRIHVVKKRPLPACPERHN